MKIISVLCLSLSLFALNSEARVTKKIAYYQETYVPTITLTTEQEANKVCKQWRTDSKARTDSIIACGKADTYLYNNGSAEHVDKLCKAIGVNDFNTCISNDQSAAITTYCSTDTVVSIPNGGNGLVTPTAATVAAEKTSCTNDNNAVAAECKNDRADIIAQKNIIAAQQTIIDNANAAIIAAQKVIAAAKVREAADNTFMNANSCNGQ